MKDVKPETFLISRPSLDWNAIDRYLISVGGKAWSDRVYPAGLPDGEALTEFAGRACYRSWEPGLNKNVTAVRTDSDAYLSNIISTGHGSVLEHAQYTFVLHNCSRVFTHEIVRHRPGVAISQESLRYVRLDDISAWQPDWALADPELQERVRAHVEDGE